MSEIGPFQVFAASILIWLKDEYSLLVRRRRREHPLLGGGLMELAGCVSLGLKFCPHSGTVALSASPCKNSDHALVEQGRVCQFSRCRRRH